MKKAISTAKAPEAIGPYSQAVSSGDLVFVSGQIPLDPQTGRLTGEDAAAQTERVLKNLEAILEAAGLGFKHVVKTTVFLKSMSDFQAMNEAYSRAFGGHGPFPARATVEVSGLPKGALVEIELVARRN